MNQQRRKVDLVVELAFLVRVPPPRMSTGSTEPRQIFDMVDDALGLRLQVVRRLTKQEIAREIVRAAGNPWLPSFESRGGTVTREGLQAVVGAVRLLVGKREG